MNDHDDSGLSRPTRRRLLGGALVLGGLAAAGRWAVSVLRSRPPDDRVFDLRRAPHVDPADASNAFRWVLEEIELAGDGGVLQVPPGEWVVDRPVDLTTTGVTLRGAGLRTTRIRLRDGVANAAVRLLADDTAVERLTLVGNRRSHDETPNLLGVRDNADFVSIRDVVVENAAGYGIGFQKTDGRVGGVFNRFSLRNVTILDAGNDGIDIKNYDASSPACPDQPWDAEPSPTTPPECNGTRSFMRHISVERHGREFEAPRRKTGIDLRGTRHLQGVDVVDVEPESNALSFRPETGGYPNGKGAQWSTLQSYFIQLLAGPEEDEPAAGILGQDTPGIVFANGHTVPAG